MFLNTSWGHGDTRTRSSIRLGEILTNRLVIHISRRRLPRASQKVKFRHNIPFSLNHETPAGLSHILGYQSSLRQARKLPGSTGQSGIRLITATRLSASTAPELALDGRLPLPAVIPFFLAYLAQAFIMSSPLGGLPVAQTQPWAPPLSQIPTTTSKT